MPGIYFDTSALIPAFVLEGSSQHIVNALAACAVGDVTISLWTKVEFASALAGKLRTKQIDEALHRSAMQTWQAFMPTATLIAIEDGDFDQAADYCRRGDLGLRAGDALHLAVAKRAGLALATLDRRLADAAMQVRVPLSL